MTEILPELPGASMFHKHILFQVSDEGKGVAGISNMLTITRLHNSISAAAVMRRSVYISVVYFQLSVKGMGVACISSMLTTVDDFFPWVPIFVD